MPRTSDPSAFFFNVETQLRNLHNECTAVELAAVEGVAYEDMIHVMDLAMKVGLGEVGLTDPPGLATKPPDARRRMRAPTVCTASQAKPVKIGSESLMLAWNGWPV